MSYRVEIIRSKDDARKILEALEPSSRETGLFYRDPTANGVGGTVYLWKDDEGDFWTYAAGRGWWDQGETHVGGLDAATNFLFRDRRYWNATERRREADPLHW